MSQIRLDGTEQAPFARESEPSREAAETIGTRLPELEARVLACLRSHAVALSDEQIQELCRMPGDTERPRRVTLVRMGLVRAAGTGRNDRGRKVTLWEAA